MPPPRVVVAEEGFRSQISSLEDECWGYIVGYFQGDYLSFLAITPPPEDGAEDWAIEHATQVMAMLPGGLTIKGLFNARREKDPGSYPHAHKILKSIVSKSLVSDEETEGFLFMDVDLNSGDPVLYDVELNLSKMGSSNSSKKFLQLQFQETIPWTRIKGHFLLDFSSLRTIDSPKADESQGFSRHIQQLLDNLETLLKTRSLITFNHEFLLEGNVTDTNSEVLEAQILLEEDTIEQNTSEVQEVVDTSSKLKLGGRVGICGFLKPKATIREACEVVIQDILRSLRARFQIHGDTLEVDDKNMTTEVEGPVIHEPPRRVLVSVPKTSNIYISDYLFSGEGCCDSTISVKELFGFEPIQDDMDDEIELVVNSDEIKVEDDYEKDTYSHSSRGRRLVAQGIAKHPYIGYIIAFGVVLASISLYYLFKDHLK